MQCVCRCWRLDGHFEEDMSVVYVRSLCVKDFLMDRIDLIVVDRVRLTMPWSEVVIHMHLAGQLAEVKVLHGWMAQVWWNGRKCGLPVTWGEVGIYKDVKSGPYAYDGKLVGGPNCTRVYFVYASSFTDDPVTAVFVDDPFTWNPDGGCLSAYAHFGQHTSAAHAWVLDQRAAMPQEYAPLLGELQQQGNRLAVLEALDGLIVPKSHPR